jgi:predicted nucleic acid-binding protein
VYLLDTNVISSLAPTKMLVRHELVDWLTRHSSTLYLSVVTVAEIEDGIARARRADARLKAARLSEWLDAVIHLYSRRILGLDVAAARQLGRLADRARGLGQAPGFADLAIAAIAQVNGLTILTRNLRHFQPLGLAALDPFDALPTLARQ